MSKALKNKVKLNDWVSVKDFGAVGDGVTDDTAAIVLALAANPSGYARIIIGGTDYVIPYYNQAGQTTPSTAATTAALSRRWPSSPATCTRSRKPWSP